MVQEILKNGKLGKLIPIKDKKRLAQIINELNNPSPIKQDKFRSRKISYEKYSKKYNLLFKELTNPTI